MKIADSEQNTFKHWGRLLFYTFLLSLAVRIVFFSLLRDFPLLYTHSVDEKYYLALGRAIAEGQLLGGDGPFFMDPFYGYFLGSLFLLFGKNLTTIRLIQILLDSFGVILIYAIGQRVWDRKAAIIAALIYALYSISFYYTLLMLKTTVAVTAILVFVLLLLVVIEKPLTSRWLFLGVAAGILTYIRANFLLIVPLTLIFYFFLQRPNWKIFGKNCIIFAAGCLTVLSLNAVRNYQVTGQATFLVTQSGRLLYSCNNPENTSGRFNVPSFSRFHPVESERDFHKEAQKRAGKMLSPEEASRFWRNETLRVLTKNPEIVPVLIFNKLKWTLANYEIPMNQSYALFAQASGLAKWPLPNFAFVFAFGLPGLALGAWYRRKVAWLLIPIFTILATMLIFCVSSRFRMPMVPFLMIGTGICLSTAAQWARNRRWGKALLIVFIVTPLFLTSMGISAPEGDGYKESALAKAYLQQDNPQKAKEVALDTLEKFQENEDLYFILSSVMFSEGRYDKSIKYLLAVLEMNPGDKATQKKCFLNLGKAYDAAGQNPKAVQYYEKYLGAASREDSARQLVHRRLTEIR